MNCWVVGFSVLIFTYPVVDSFLISKRPASPHLDPSLPGSRAVNISQFLKSGVSLVFSVSLKIIGRIRKY